MLYGCCGRFALRSLRSRVIFFVIACCVVANIFLIRSVTRVSNIDIASKTSSFSSLLAKNFVLANGEYRLKSVRDTYLNCATIASSVKRGDYIASGWTKSTYKGTYDGTTDVAVKVVNDNGHDISECLKKGPKKSLDECRRDASAKVLGEILYHSWLNHSNIAKMYGYCIPDKPDTMAGDPVIIMELGEPLGIIRLLQMSWEDRLRVSLGLARLLSYMGKTAHGPVMISDFRRQQFIMCEGEVKLCDLDDVGFGDPTCSRMTDCEIVKGIQVQCVSGSCRDFAVRSNILKTGRHFMHFLLTPNAPQLLERRVKQIVDAYENASWSTDQLLQHTQLVAELFSNGSYRSPPRSHLTDYVRQNQSDLPGRFDYRCRLTLLSNSCVLSVFDEEEAAEMCSSDGQCKAFVVTQQRSWTGRKLVYFKNGYGTPTDSSATTLYRRNG